MEDLISIIVPVYNSEKYIEKCINSLINQTYENLEIIIINDGSKDKSLEKIRKIAKMEQRIKVVSKENSGVSSTRNKGIELSNGKYIIFIDSDDYVEPNFVEVLHKNLIENDVDLVSCAYYLETGNKLEPRYIKEKNNILNRNELYSSTINFESGITQSPCNKIFKANIIKKNNLCFPISIKVGEDMLFNIEYISFCEKGFFVNDILYHYIRDNLDSATNSNNFTDEDLIKSMKSYEIVIENFKNKGLDEVVLNSGKEQYINTYKGWMARAIVQKYQNKELLNKYKTQSLIYYNEIKKNYGIVKKIKNFICLYFPKFYLKLFNMKNK